MRNRKRAVLGCLGVFLGTLTLAGILVAWQWEAVSVGLAEQRTKGQAFLFRLGEVLSMQSEVKDQFGFEPQASYDTSTGQRIVILAFSDLPLPSDVAPREYARDIAAFVLQGGRRAEHIDAIEVRLSLHDFGYVFEVAELEGATPREAPKERLAIAESGEGDPR